MTEGGERKGRRDRQQHWADKTSQPMSKPSGEALKLGRIIMRSWHIIKLRARAYGIMEASRWRGQGFVEDGVHVKYPKVIMS